MVLKKRYVWFIVFVMTMSLACSLGPISGSRDAVEELITGFIDAEVTPQLATEETTTLVEEPTPEWVDLEPAASPQPTLEEIAPPQFDQDGDHNRGQIAFIMDGQVFYQNLTVGEIRQLTFEVEQEVDHRLLYTKLEFSDSGRYLAYQFGPDFLNNTYVTVYDLLGDKEISQMDDKMLMGWRYGEDILLVGENSIFCDPNEYPPDHLDESVDFLIFAFDPVNMTISHKSTITGGRRAPRTLESQLNLIHFSSSPCAEMSWPITNWVFSDQGEAYTVKSAWQFAFSQTGDHYVSIIYSIHGPEEDVLEVISLGESAGLVIYQQAGKYIIEADWSPDDGRILFWMGDVELWPDSEQLMVISADGNTMWEILPTPEVVIGWYPDGRLLLLPKEMDRISLYNVDTGESETLSHLEHGFDYSQLIWQSLP